MTGFFKTENLVALRELALRFVADETEEELLRYLRDQHPGEVWDTAERIMVAVTGAPGSDGVVRRAARMARPGQGRPAASSTSDGSTGRRTRFVGRAALAAVRTLVEDVGGDVARGTGRRPGPHRGGRSPTSTRSPRSWWGPPGGAVGRNGNRGSVVRKILRFAAETGIDVHVIARREAPAEVPEERWGAC